MNNFIQIHSLHSYSAALLNRDDTGLAKRIQFGGSMRTRISSQCLKRHWREQFGAIFDSELGGSKRSRELVANYVMKKINAPSKKGELLDELKGELEKLIYGEKGSSTRQPLLLGILELDYLVKEAEKILKKSTTKNDITKSFKELDEHFKKMRKDTKLAGGLTAALFGRMVTADPEANIDAPIHVAHSFTVHEQESEIDYFSVIDDLQDASDTGAAHIGDTEINSGLYYGYMVINTSHLFDNLFGDHELARKVVSGLIELIATVSPGAKKGSTAPYGYAQAMLIEVGSRQPRSFAEAFRKPCHPPTLQETIKALNSHITEIDSIYGCEEKRKFFCTNTLSIDTADRGTLTDIASWAATDRLKS